MVPGWSSKCKIREGWQPITLDEALRLHPSRIKRTVSIGCFVQRDPLPYSPAAVVAVNYDVVSGVPSEISTSYVERSNLSLRMSCRRFTRLTNGFSKKLEHHGAAISLYVAHYNFCRVHEALRTTPAVALGITDHVWSTGELLDAASATQPITPTTTAPDRRRQFRIMGPVPEVLWERSSNKLCKRFANGRVLQCGRAGFDIDLKGNFGRSAEI